MQEASERDFSSVALGGVHIREDIARSLGL